MGANPVGCPRKNGDCTRGEGWVRGTVPAFPNIKLSSVGAAPCVRPAAPSLLPFFCGTAALGCVVLFRS